MPTCPKGHDSADAEYCDVCGLAMDQPAAVATAAAEADEQAPAPAGKLCPACDAPLAGRFCEACGHDSLAPPPPRAPVAPAPVAAPPVAAPAPLEQPAPREEEAPPAEVAAPRSWTATVSADRAYYDGVIAAGGPDADSIAFPPFCPDRFFPLRGKQISIGRRSVSRGINPDIDLTGPPEDPGVSHLHGLLIAQSDGSWAIVDLDSANGTVVNDSPKPLRANTPCQLADGDHIHLGAWTRITLRAE